MIARKTFTKVTLPFACLSAMQHDNGTFASGGSECSESCAWVIVSTTTWGINPDTDSRFIKNGISVVDALLTHYLAESATFQHIIGAGSNAMATDQSCYALVAYDRFINNKKALFDYSDVTFKDGETEIIFQYSKEVSDKTGVSTYVALVDATIDMAKFIDAKNFTIGAVSEDAITFGDINGDGEINAQDALAAVDTWLRKGEEPTDLQILTMNVNGDSRINTFDALDIVEAFVNGTEYGVVTKAATITTKQ